MEESLILKKKQSLRNNEYYEIQDVFDELYRLSNNNYKFVNLMQYVTSEQNIQLAYRNIKKNNGSTTVGTDNQKIDYFKVMKKEKFIKYFQNKFSNYIPKSVRKVEIPKANGKLRSLGIPCMDDRIIQQCIKQVLEPICEAKFHKHSYGFRPNRSASNAIARCMALINKSKLHYVVDIDIKGFFDNVNQSKLKKQIWTMGIRDKNLISIIGKILKSEIQGIGVPEKGTPQGGIISPLLANIVLNELDWWISSQWETFETKKQYKHLYKYKALKKKKLKEIWLVRYCDDFKIFCRDYKSAQNIYIATKLWLKERLGLEVSAEKSKITNLRKNYTEFLGFKLKVKMKANKYVCKSKMCHKAKRNTIMKLKNQIKIIQASRNSKDVAKLNSIILGSHNYYRYATHISKDFAEIDFLVRKTLKTRLRRISSPKPKLSEAYKRLYGGYNGKFITICGITIFPIYKCKTSAPMCFSQEACNFTSNGRELVHTKLKSYEIVLHYLLSNSYSNESIEYCDNKISLMAGQRGKCYVTGNSLKIGNMECHHKTPKALGGSDEYKNLVWLTTEVHKLIHCTKIETINKYLNVVKLDKEGLGKVNSLRKLVGNSVV